MEPTCKKNPNGHEEWRLNGQLHREDGPAYIDSDGTEEWYLNGEWHREDGPAWIGSDGYEHWYLNGEPLEPFTPEQLPLVLLSVTEL